MAAEFLATPVEDLEIPDASGEDWKAFGDPMGKVFLLQMQALRPKIKATCQSQIHSWQRQILRWAIGIVALVAVVGQMAAWSAVQMCQMVAGFMCLLFLGQIVQQLQVAAIFPEIMVDLQYRLKFNLSCRGGGGG